MKVNKEFGRQLKVVVPVIPREGVESYVVSGSMEPYVPVVIPREGVESLTCRTVRTSRLWSVIPREGVESLLKRHRRKRPPVESDPERGT